MSHMPEPNQQAGRSDSSAPRADQEDPLIESPAIQISDIAPALEFCCWVVVALAPLLRWANGAAVTSDQFVIQVTLVAFAAICAIGFRLYSWRSSQSHRE